MQDAITQNTGIMGEEAATNSNHSAEKVAVASSEIKPPLTFWEAWKERWGRGVFFGALTAIGPAIMGSANGSQEAMIAGGVILGIGLIGDIVLLAMAKYDQDQSQEEYDANKVKEQEKGKGKGKGKAEGKEVGTQIPEEQELNAKLVESQKMIEDLTKTVNDEKAKNATLEQQIANPTSPATPQPQELSQLQKEVEELKNYKNQTIAKEERDALKAEIKSEVKREFGNIVSPQFYHTYPSTQQFYQQPVTYGQQQPVYYIVQQKPEEKSEKKTERQL